MVGSRLVTAAIGLLVSLLISAAAWYYFETFLLFLFVPFVPLLLRRGDGSSDAKRVRSCPECGFQTTDSAFEYCPRDGTRLE